MSKELAEFVGVVIGDGSIRYKPDISQYYVEIAGNMYEEKDYYNYLRDLVLDVFNLKSHLFFRQGAIRLRVNSRKLVEFLVLELKMVPNKDKCKNVTIPEQIICDPRLLTQCLKGIVDTDGSLFLANKGYRKDYPSIELNTISMGLANQLKEILSTNFRIGFRSHKRGNYNRLYKISLNGDYMVDKWFNEIGFSNPKNLKKYKKLKNGDAGI